jgi:two-component system LytT family sensor kinase
MKLEGFNNKWWKAALHVAAWIIVFSLPYLLRPSFGPGSGRPKEPSRETFFLFPFITGFFWVGVFYLNAYVLTARFIYKKKYLSYIGLLLGVYCVIMIIDALLFNVFVSDRPFSVLRSASFNLTTFFLTVAASMTYKMMGDKAKADRAAKDTKEENLKTELSFLRSQISPHFVFNVLNNMVALVRLKSDELEPTIMKLSSLMQYMLYETDEEKVLLKTEAEYLQSYIDLQQQRFGSNVKLSIAIDVDDTGYTIEPMLMIPFVENAFKHGVGMIDKPEIEIKLYLNANTLHFTVRNKYNEVSSEVKDKTSGIGLNNVMRRLKLLYGAEHELLITKDGGMFSVLLQLNLH